MSDRWLVMVFLMLLVPIFNGKAVAEKMGVERLPVCMDFGCKNRQVIDLNAEDWQEVADWFREPAENSEQEREQIKQAIGWMEVVVGRHTPTHRDVGGNWGEDSSKVQFPGQLDCIDESTNTSTYLHLFESKELLKHHRVLERAYRRTVFDQHWAGQILDIATGEHWVVDSWFQHNGFLPYVQRSEQWEDIPIFTSYLDSSQKANDERGFFGRLFGL